MRHLVPPGQRPLTHWPAPMAALVALIGVLSCAPGSSASPPAPVAGGGAASPEMVPRALAVAAASEWGPGAGPPVFQVGVMPSLLDTIMGAPPGATIVGSVAWSPRYVTVFGHATGGPDAVRKWYAADFVRRGWTHPVSTRGASFGGFVDAPPAIPTEFCRGVIHASVHTTDNPALAANFSVQINQPPFTDACSAPIGPGGQLSTSTVGRMVQEGMAPLLTNPPAVTVGPFSCGAFSSAGSSTQEANARSTMSPTQILALYGKQLAAAGWAPAGEVTQMWAKRDSAGREARVSITVSTGAADSTCRSLRMTLQTAR